MTKTIATDGHVSVETSISADEKTPRDHNSRPFRAQYELRRQDEVRGQNSQRYPQHCDGGELMDYDELTAVDIVDGVTNPKNVIVKGASIYTENQRGGPIYKETNTGEVVIRVDFFKTATPTEQAQFLQKLEEVAVDVIHEHSRMESWAR